MEWQSCTFGQKLVMYKNTSVLVNGSPRQNLFPDPNPMTSSFLIEFLPSKDKNLSGLKLCGSSKYSESDQWIVLFAWSWRHSWSSWWSLRDFLHQQWVWLRRWRRVCLFLVIPVADFLVDKSRTCLVIYCYWSLPAFIPFYQLAMYLDHSTDYSVSFTFARWDSLQGHSVNEL